jgi:hypothetical protein
MLPRDDKTTLVLEHTVEKAKKKHHWEKHPPAEASPAEARPPPNYSDSHQKCAYFYILQVWFILFFST